MKNIILFASLCAVAVSGCATEHALVPPNASLYRAGLISDPVQAAKLGEPSAQINMAKLLDAKVQVRFPTTLTIARLTTSYYGAELQTIDTKELKAWEKILADQSLITAVQPLAAVAVRPSTDEKGNRRPMTLRDLRHAAAMQNSEILLVYLQADSQVENLNHAAGLYWTGVGLFLVPGTDVEHKTVMQAALVDTRSGIILGAATGDSHGKRTSAAAFVQIQHDLLSKETPRESLKDLQANCGRLINNVTANAGRSQ